MSPTSYQTAPPRDKAGAEVYDRSIAGSIQHPPTRKPANAGFLVNWYREGDSNPYTHWAQPPQGCVSTNSTTSALQLFGVLAKTSPNSFLLLLWSLRCISRNNCWLLLFENRHITCRRLLLHFQYCRVWQTYLSQLLSLLFSKVT